MVTTVYVDLDEPCATLDKSVEYLQGLIPSHYKVRKEGSALAVDVPESNDATTEFTRVMNNNLIRGYCYEPDPDEKAANNLSPEQLREAANNTPSELGCSDD